MNLKVPLKREVDIYKAYLYTVNWMRKKSLSNKEIEVMAAFMYFNNKYKDLESEIRQEVLFSKKVKDKIKDMLGMKSVVFDNYYKALRDKGVIRDGEIIKSLQIYPKEGKFNFNIEYASSTS